MSYKLYRLRFRRVFKRHRRLLEAAGDDLDQHLERHFFRRMHHLPGVGWFLLLWLVPVLALIGVTGWQLMRLTSYYQHTEPAKGGIYKEGIIGEFTNANPIYATSDVDESVSRLIFAGLFRYDSNDQLVGDLASGYKLSDDGRIYTVYLKPNLTWQDGKPLSASDVAFTYHTIQNPDAGSPLAPNWQGVDVSTNGPSVVIFKLPNPLASFKYSLTTGIIPEHILGSVPPNQLRGIEFDTTDPVGAGPFSWGSIETNGGGPGTLESQIALEPFAGYAGGGPKLGGFIINTYPTTAIAEQALLSNSINGLAGLEVLPPGWHKDSQLQIYSVPIMSEATVFFKESNPILSDVNVRKALVLAANRGEIVASLPFKTQIESEPLLPNQLGYNPSYTQPSYDLAAAKQTLASDGWVSGKLGILEKNGTPLSFNLYASSSAISGLVTRELAQEWRMIGVKVNIYLENANDYQDTLSSHGYDAVLYDMPLGTDPDEYVYWDSTQADPRSATRLNLSELDNSSVDSGLEEGRTRDNPALRAIKYRGFLQAWLANEPALILYQPHFLYVTSRPLYNFSNGSAVNTVLGRYNNVTDWEIRQTEVTD